ncbi:MAG: GDP-mannose 4,6-dehydratase [Sulfolobales archaeon]
MRILVTGGAGFIGHNVAIYLSSRGYDVVVYDTLERSSETAIKRLEDAGIPIYRKDVRDVQDLRGYDVVIHCAAYVDVAESIANPRIYFENNVVGTASIAKAAADSEALFIYISSAAVYGDPIKIPIPEEHPIKPISPYGASKAMGEQVVELYSRIYGLRYLILRLFNVYGPGQNPAYAGVISRFIESAINRIPPRIYGDGSQTRDFIHVEDVARAIELSIARQPHNQVFNIGSGKHISILELARLIMRLANLEGEPIFDRPRPGDIKHSCADIEKARKILGFEPKITLEEGIKKLLNIYGIGLRS